MRYHVRLCSTRVLCSGTAPAQLCPKSEISNDKGHVKHTSTSAQHTVDRERESRWRGGGRERMGSQAEGESDGLGNCFLTAESWFHTGHFHFISRLLCNKLSELAFTLSHRWLNSASEKHTTEQRHRKLSLSFKDGCAKRKLSRSDTDD